jgi:long-chain fatty acid transport protein
MTAGVTIKPTATTEIGIGYRSAIFTDIDGTIAAPNPANPFTTAVTNVKTVLATPDMVTLSAKQSITDDIRVLGTFRVDKLEPLERAADHGRCDRRHRDHAAVQLQ